MMFACNAPTSAIAQAGAGRLTGNMAGRRTHILPRFLLKGFAKKIRGDQVYVWRYAAAQASLPTNVINVAVERDFYGRPDEPIEADTAITEIEKSYGPVVGRLRDGAPGPVHDPLIASFIVHLSSRTKHLRTSFAECADQLFEEMAHLFGDPDRFGELMLAQASIPGFIEAEVRAALPAPLQAPAMRQQVEGLIRQRIPEFIKQNKTACASLAAAALQQARQRVGEFAASGQIRALAKLQLENPRTELLQQLHWSVQDCTEALVLGDSACLFELDGDPTLRPFPEDPDRTHVVGPLRVRV